MQLYAWDEKKAIIFIETAYRQQNYFCPECGSTVRARGGTRRRNHFFHLTGSNCRQSRKSIEHIQTQIFIKENFAPEALLERRFDSIARIADVCWEAEKVIFEIQCSPITAEEVRKRNQDYRLLGYQVIWVLHEKTFNKNKLTATEHFLIRSPHYFTDINEEGVGIIYDQKALLRSGRRFGREKRVEVSAPVKRSPLKGERASWQCHLEGTLAIGEEVESRWKFSIKERCKAFFQALLESACR